MKLKIFGLGLALFFLLGIFATFSVYSAQGDITLTNTKIQINIEGIYLSSDGGSNYGINLLSSATGYIEFDSNSSTTLVQKILESIQLSEGSTYNKIKVVLNPAVKVQFTAAFEGVGTYYPKNATSTQLLGFAETDVTQVPGEIGWWTMTLTDPKQIIVTDFIDSMTGYPVDLSIHANTLSTLKIKIDNIYNGVWTGAVGGSTVTTDADPSASTTIYLQ